MCSAARVSSGCLRCCNAPATISRRSLCAGGGGHFHDTPSAHSSIIIAITSLSSIRMPLFLCPAGVRNRKRFSCRRTPALHRVRAGEGPRAKRHLPASRKPPALLGQMDIVLIRHNQFLFAIIKTCQSDCIQKINPRSWNAVFERKDLVLRR